MATIKVLCLYFQAVTAWLPHLATQPLDEYEDDDEEMSDEERRHFELLEQQLLLFSHWLWNHGEGKDYGTLRLRWSEDGEFDLDLDKRAVMRLLHFLCSEEQRRRHDLEYDC